MNRTAKRFAALRKSGRTALIPYLTAGDPDPDSTVPLLHTLVKHGADLIEIGVPFSDPMADGPVIQAACERALAHHVSLSDTLEMARDFRTRDADTPLILMGYCNPIEAMGLLTFAEGAATAGIDGVLTVDLPPEEAREMARALTEQGLDAVFLIAPTTTDDRARQIIAEACGFLYYISLRGTTGTQNVDLNAAAHHIERLRPLTHLPIGIGFGIRSGVDAARAAHSAEAVVVGSALIEASQENKDPAEGVARLMDELRRGIDAADRGDS